VAKHRESGTTRQHDTGNCGTQTATRQEKKKGKKKKDGGIIHTRGIAVGHGKGAAATNTAAHGRPETLGFGLLDLDVLATKKKKKPEIS